MRQILDECEQSKKKEGREYITLKRGGVVSIEEKEEDFVLNFFTFNGKKKSVELLISPKKYSIEGLKERNCFIEVNISRKKRIESIYFDLNGNFVTMGAIENFVIRNEDVKVISRCGQLYSEYSLQNLVM